VGPGTVQIDLTDACEQSCAVCWLHAPTLPERTRSTSLPWPLLERLLDELESLGTREIYFAGGGEPLLHPQAWHALEGTLRRGMTASLHTSFARVDEAGVRRLLELGVHHLTVSLWAASKEVYAATHPGTDPETFDRVTERLVELNRRKADRPTTKLYHVLTGANADELGAMLAFAGELGCDAVEVAVADLIPGATEHLGITAAQAGAAIEALEPWLRRAAWRRPRLLGGGAIRSRLEAVAAGCAPDGRLVHALPCFAGWTYARVLADGRVIPCLKAHRAPSGSLHEQSFAAIWAGAKQRAFRRRAREVQKRDPWFAQIGNGPAGDGGCGCERGCDNLADNVATGQRLRSLSWIERAGLGLVGRLPELAIDRLGARR
jgi:MoaA/NifB/PqqE/SkfB family radical SAM enzyme